MEKLIKQSAIWNIMEERQAGKPKPFDFQVCIASGELRNYKNATLTSIHSKGNTLNVLLDGKRYPNTFRRIGITRFNDYKVYI